MQAEDQQTLSAMASVPAAMPDADAAAFTLPDQQQAASAAVDGEVQLTQAKQHIECVKISLC